MTKPPANSPDSAERRRKAEARLRSRRGADPAATAGELLRLRHELEVHQIELEMQNEELQRALSTASGALAEYTNLYDTAPCGYFTIGRDGVIVRVNRPGASMLGHQRDQLVGKRLAAFVVDHHLLALDALITGVFLGKPADPCDVQFASPALDQGVGWMQLVASLVEDGQHCQVVATDVSERKHLEAEREALMVNLTRALHDVKTLRGIIPVCAWCRRIRNDEGFWQQVEAYLQQHSEAQFSHGICPECAKQWDGHPGQSGG